MPGPLDTIWRWKSWVQTANDPDSGFPLQNLPFCAFQRDGSGARLGIGIGDLVLDLRGCAELALFDGLPENVREACRSDVLNALMQCGPAATARLRGALMLLLREDASDATIEALSPLMRPMTGVAYCTPVSIGDYTDFYASVHHATNVGRLFRPDQPLLPNYKHVPIGYHGRASSIVVGGTPVKRPRGQLKLASEGSPVFAPSRQLDFELEVGAYVGTGNCLGHPIQISEAERHIFGVTLVNDWSARDIQAWEYQPLGPFLGKSFATSISPWIVSLAALGPFRSPLAPRASGDPEPLPYLQSTEPQSAGMDIQLEVYLSTALMRERGLASMRLAAANTLDLYWSFPQMLTHHSSNGCNLRSGDLIASGTVSGAEEGSLGSLLEITRKASVPLTLPTGEIRFFLEDGDEVTITGRCHRPGLPVISLGECRGTVLQADR